MQNTVTSADADLFGEKTMSDLISRQKTVEILVSMMRDCFPEAEEELDAVVTTVREIPSAEPDNQVHLCDSCHYCYPECPAEMSDVIFGNGIGHDNVCACAKFEIKPEQKKGKWLNLDALISEQNEIMKKNFDKKDKDPEASLRFGMARSIKTYLLRKYAEKNNTEFCGNWETGIDGKERCSICWTPKKYSDLNGKCVICDADMRGK